MRKFSFIPATLALALALTACDYIEGPKVDETAFPSSGNKILLEDFTGHQCGNCPRAHEKAVELKAIYGENLIVIANHVGGFANVNVPRGYIDDFKTPMGNDIATYFDPDAEGLPIGMVNRRFYNNKQLIKYANWSAVIAQVLAEDPKLKIDLTLQYDAISRKLDVTTDLEYYSAGDVNHQLVVVITEDSLDSQQADYSLPSPSHIEHYQQMHVLRASMTTGAWGEQIKNAPIFAGEKFTRDFSTTLDTAMVPKNCAVVAYVLNNTTKEVLQAETIHVGE